MACCYFCKCCCFAESGAKQHLNVNFTNLAPPQPELVGVPMVVATVVGQGKGADTE